MQVIVNNLAELETLAEYINSFLPKDGLVLLSGNLGAGKTTLVKFICEHRGVKNEIASPTYSIINEYRSPENAIFHIDLYRLSDLEEALNIGIADYLETENLCFVEWAEIVETILPKSYFCIQIEKIDDNQRKISIFKVYN